MTAIIGVSVVVIVFLFRLTTAGSLTPTAAPATSMESLEDVYGALVGTFDSSGIVASKQGGAMEISKCIISAVTGGAGCP
jgi:hypothetical protein